VAGLILLAAAAELVAAAGGYHPDVWGVLPVPADRADRIALLVVVLAACIALAGLALREQPSPLELTVAGGSLRLPPATVAAYLHDVLAEQPDVVATRSRISLHDGSLTADLWVALRPLTPAAELEPLLRGLAVAALRDRLALPADVRSLTTRVLTVPELPRYLRT